MQSWFLCNHILTKYHTSFFLECSNVLPQCVVFLVIVATTLQIANADGVIGFKTKHVIVEEKQYQQATFNLIRESGTTGLILFYCRVCFVVRLLFASSLFQKFVRKIQLLPLIRGLCLVSIET